jgi:uncharacterized membrane protein
MHPLYLVFGARGADVYATIVLPADIGIEPTVVLCAATAYAAFFLAAQLFFMASLIHLRAAADRPASLHKDYVLVVLTSGSSRMLNEPNGCTTAFGRSFFIAWLPGSETL